MAQRRWGDDPTRCNTFAIGTRHAATGCAEAMPVYFENGLLVTTVGREPVARDVPIHDTEAEAIAWAKARWLCKGGDEDLSATDSTCRTSPPDICASPRQGRTKNLVIPAPSKFT